MSITSEITRIMSAKAALKSVINSRGGMLTSETIDAYPAAVSGLPQGADVSGVTANASDVTSGTLFVTSGGILTSGTLPVVQPPAPSLSFDSSAGVVTAAYTPSAGRVNDTSVKSGTLQIPTASAAVYTPTTSNQIISAGVYLGGSQTILGDENLAAENIKSGTSIFGVSGSYQGSGGSGSGIDPSGVTAEASDVTVSKMFITSGGVLTSGSLAIVTQPAPTVSIDSATGEVTAAYTPSAGRVTDTSSKSGILQLPVISGGTVVPGVSSFVAASSGKYVLSDVVVAGDSNLVGSNIASGVSIFNVTGTYQGSGGSGGSGGAYPFALTKITQYVPYRAAFVGIGSMTVSGIPAEAYDMPTGAEGANGTYTVTSDTQYLTGADRVYKHTTSNYWMVGFEDTYNTGGPCWAIVDASQLGEPSVWNCVCYCSGSAPASGEWTNNTSYWSAQLTVSSSTISYPEQSMVLSGRQAEGYDPSTKLWSFSSAATVYSSFQRPPQPCFIYAATGGALVGGAVGFTSEFPGYGALFALDASLGSTELIGGGSATTYGSGTVLSGGEFCFDGARGLDYTVDDTLNGLKDFTVEMDFTITSNATGYCGMFFNKTGWGTDAVGLQWGRYGYQPSMFWNNYSIDNVSGGPSHPEWISDGVYHHVALVRKGSMLMLFCDGVLLAYRTEITAKLHLAVQQQLSIGVQHIEQSCFPGRMKHFRVVPAAIYTEDFSGDLPPWIGAGQG